MRIRTKNILIGAGAALALIICPTAVNADPVSTESDTAPAQSAPGPNGDEGASAALETVEETGPSAMQDAPQSPVGDDTATSEFAQEVPAPTSGQPRATLTPIREIQTPGEGDDSALVGSVVTTRGVVTGVHPKGEDGLKSTLDGFVIQSPGTGGAWDPARTASDGLFVYVGKKNVMIPEIGQCVQVRGKVGEFPATGEDNPAATRTLTQLSVSNISVVDGCEKVEATSLDGVPTADQMEALESMLIAPQGPWTITDNYQANGYGTLSITPGTEPLRAATDVVSPGEAARAYEADNAAKAIALDDGTNTNLQRGAATDVPYAYLANGSPARVGYRVDFTAPVILDYRHSAFRFQPTRMVAAHPDRSPVNITGTRPEVPTVNGDITVATFNVLNYFPDLGQDEAGCKGYPDREGNFVTSKKCSVRGAWSRGAFENQQAKIVRAISAINADVVALEEIENPVGVGIGTDRDAALKNLVDALNAAAGSEVWAHVPSPSTTPANEDVIRVAFIYRPATITPVGESQILDDPAFTGLARQPLAQKFTPVVTEGQQGTEFVVVANHFKSKGSIPEGMEEGNTDSGDGQGNSNAIRVAQARALATFATRFDGTPTLLVGDFNSYSMEDPLQVLKDAGWVHESAGSHASYVYSGRSGSLDHVFSNPAADPLVTSVASWGLNAEESVAFEYSRANANAHLMIETDNPYRSSDHNPEIVGLDVISDKPAVPTPPGTQPQTQTPQSPKPTDPSTSAGATATAKGAGLAKTGANGWLMTASGMILLLGFVLVASTRRATERQVETQSIP